MSTQAVTSLAYSPRQLLGFGIESTRGTPVNPAVLLPFEGDFTVDAKQPLLDVPQVTGRLDPVAPLQQWLNVEGKGVAVPTDPVAFTYWLSLIFGAPSSGVYSLPATYAAVPSATIYREMPDIGQYMRYAGCMANAWDVSFGENLYARSTVQLVALGETISGTPPGGSPTSVVAATPYERTTGTVTIGGATTAIVTGFYMQLNLNLRRYKYPNQSASYTIAYTAGQRHLYGSMVLALDPTYAATQYTNAVNATAQAVSLALVNGGHSMTIDFPYLTMARPVLRRREDQYLSFSFDWTATRPDPAAQLLTVTVT